MELITELFFEFVLELFTEGLFALIRKFVKNRFLRGVLYVLAVVLVVAVAFGVLIGLFALGAWVIESVLAFLATLLDKLNL